MSQAELLKSVAGTLEALGIPFMLTGSLAASLLGEPRSTHDIDLVVELEPTQVANLVAKFPPPDFYLDAAAARRAVQCRQMFNLIDNREGDKVDFWLLTDDPFDLVRFARRIYLPFAQTMLPVSTPEDTILQKLRWSRASGGSRLQRQDAAGIYRVWRYRLDRSYVESWVARGGLIDEWRQVQQLAAE